MSILSPPLCLLLFARPVLVIFLCLLLNHCWNLGPALEIDNGPNEELEAPKLYTLGWWNACHHKVHCIASIILYPDFSCANVGAIPASVGELKLPILPST